MVSEPGVPESMAGRGKEGHSETGGNPAVQSLRESVKSLELKVNVIANDLQKVLNCSNRNTNPSHSTNQPLEGWQCTSSSSRSTTTRGQQNRKDNMSESKPDATTPREFQHPQIDSKTNEELDALVHHELICCRNAQQQRNWSQDYKQKFDIPHFDGKMYIEECLDWLNAVETFFECMDIA